MMAIGSGRSFSKIAHEGKTRLISRNRFRLPKLKDRLGMIPMEPGSLIMERRPKLLDLGFGSTARAASGRRS
jgi:hypothetical protein